MNSTVMNPLWPLDRELFIADGEPYVFDDTLYLYGSRDVFDGEIDGYVEWCSRDYHVVCTRDMKTWEDCGVSYTMDEIPLQYREERPARLWAPDLCFNPKDGKYYLFSCLNKGRGIFAASSESPKGPFTDTKRLKIDGEDTFPKCIDPGVLLDDDGKAYITWPGGEDHPWSIAQLDPDDYSNVLGETITPVVNLRFPFEGPSLRKRGDTYYYIYIQNVLGPKTFPRKPESILPCRMVYMTSKSPLGPYKQQGTIIDTSDFPGAVNVHGSFIEWKGQWYLFYHLPLQSHPLTRFACASLMEFNPDGTIVQVKPTSCGPRAAFLPGETIPAYTAVIYSEGRGDYDNHTEPNEADRCDHLDPGDRHLFFDRPGQYAGFRYVDFGENAVAVIKLKARCRSGATVEVRSDEHDGQLLATLDMPPSEAYRESTAPLLSPIYHRHAVYLVLRDKPGQERLCVASINFQGDRI